MMANMSMSNFSVATDFGFAHGLPSMENSYKLWCGSSRVATETPCVSNNLRNEATTFWLKEYRRIKFELEMASIAKELGRLAAASRINSFRGVKPESGGEEVVEVIGIAL